MINLFGNFLSRISITQAFSAITLRPTSGNSETLLISKVPKIKRKLNFEKIKGTDRQTKPFRQGGLRTQNKKHLRNQRLISNAKQSGWFQET